jgi:hypothetical protein
MTPRVGEDEVTIAALSVAEVLAMERTGEENSKTEGE